MDEKKLPFLHLMADNSDSVWQNLRAMIKILDENTFNYENVDDRLKWLRL